MLSPRILAIGLLLVGCTAVSGCDIAPSQCTSNNCVVTVKNSGGQIVVQGSNAPSYPPLPPSPVAAEKLCISLGGDWYESNPSDSFTAHLQDGKWYGIYICENLPYIGSDGGSYYFSPVDITYGQLDIVQDPEALSASPQECESGVFPGRSPYNSYSGIWVSAYGYCRPKSGD